jgi:RNA 3'-terminal phosphate cyclase (ATP)
MITIDGARGEGGGQVLRTALALAAITGQPVRLDNIRAGRKNPGLAPQHLTGVRALAALCQADVRGDALRSTSIEFHPQAAIHAGDYSVDVAEATSGGSAGAVTLVLQAMLVPLALAGGESRVILRGGTHVPWSPPFHYLSEVFLPMVAPMGVRADVRLDTWGFYPAGGGQVSADIHGQAGPLTAQDWTVRGDVTRVWGLAVAASLPAHIAQRMAGRAANLLQEAGLRPALTPVRERAASPGATTLLFAAYENSFAGFSALGEKGKPSEQVATEAALDLLAQHRSGQAVDMHLADQLLLPMALAAGTSRFTTCRVTQHLLTNAEIIRHFISAEIIVDGDELAPGTVTVTGVGWANGPAAQPGPLSPPASPSAH